MRGETIAEHCSSRKQFLTFSVCLLAAIMQAEAKMTGTFTLLDLRTQALAVQRLLTGRSAEEKLTWLAERGQVARISTAVPNAPPTYYFVSSIGMECPFFIDGDKLVLLGEHTVDGGSV